VGYIIVGSTLATAEMVTNTQKDVAQQIEQRMRTNIEIESIKFMLKNGANKEKINFEKIMYLAAKHVHEKIIELAYNNGAENFGVILYDINAGNRETLLNFISKIIKKNPAYIKKLDASIKLYLFADGKAEFDLVKSIKTTSDCKITPKGIDLFFSGFSFFSFSLFRFRFSSSSCLTSKVFRMEVMCS
jgi:hypothetical protein